jgi:CRP/FNR family transcriptional regulator, cyclic AMP receptor protein
MNSILQISNTLIPEDDVWFSKVGRYDRLPKGAVLIREGEPINTLVFILNGVVSISVAGMGEIASAANGEIVGEMSLLQDTLPFATVTAAEAIDVLTIGRRELQAKLESDPKFASRFYRMIAQFLSVRLSRTIERLDHERKSTNPVE